MKDYITEEYDKYKSCALQFDYEHFTNDVLKSFKEAKTYRHYVILITCHLDEYFTRDEQASFEKYGYYQQPIEERCNNRFFIPSETINQARDILVHEKMYVQETVVNGVPTYVVSINGMDNTFFAMDFATKQ